MEFKSSICLFGVGVILERGVIEMADITEMRAIVTRKYSSETPKGKAWPKKVRAMSDSQIIAIYLRIQDDEKRKNQRKEWEDYPLYAG